MREICKSGSEGGASQANETSLPLSAMCASTSRRKVANESFVQGKT